MKQKSLKKLVLLNAPYLLFALLGTKLGQAARLAPGNDFVSKLRHIMEGLGMSFQTAVPSFHPIDLCAGIAVALAIRLSVYSPVYKFFNHAIYSFYKGRQAQYIV